MENLQLIALIAGIIVGFYEVLVRAIPSVGNNSFVHLIIEILRRISEFLNRKKK